MGEGSPSQIPRLVDSVIAPAGASTNAVIPSAATSKIPFRPRKIRRISSSAPATTNDAPKKTLAVRVIPRPLSSEGEVSASISHLRAVDPLLSAVIDAHDPPTFQCLVSPFHSLARSILYQQLAVKAASSIYGRFVTLCGGEPSVVPDVVLSLTTQQLRQIGVSERKASYLHDLSRKYHGGILSDSSIIAMDDKSLFSMLTMVKGIGAWSVHMFMIFCLHRPDVLPVGDLGVRKGVQILYGLDEVPRPSQMEQLCDRWRPYRSVGSWYMWRVVETKNNFNLASPNAEALTMSTVALADVQQQEHKQTLQEQMVDSYQMLPQSWTKSISPTGGARGRHCLLAAACAAVWSCGNPVVPGHNGSRPATIVMRRAVSYRNSRSGHENHGQAVPAATSLPCSYRNHHKIVVGRDMVSIWRPLAAAAAISMVGAHDYATTVILRP